MNWLFNNNITILHTTFYHINYLRQPPPITIFQHIIITYKTTSPSSSSTQHQQHKQLYQLSTKLQQHQQPDKMKNLKQKLREEKESKPKEKEICVFFKIVRPSMSPCCMVKSIGSTARDCIVAPPLRQPPSPVSVPSISNRVPFLFFFTMHFFFSRKVIGLVYVWKSTTLLIFYYSFHYYYAI